jgi:hypothetical protein
MLGSVTGWVQTFVLVGLAALATSLPANAQTSAQPPPPLSALRAPQYQNTVTLRWVQNTTWELYVENTNHSRFINVFNWAPPAGLTIKQITSSQGGNCRVNQGTIQCSGNIAPVSCSTCEGGAMTIDFVGTGFAPAWVHTDYGGYWFSQGWMPGVLNVTVTSSFGDLPQCAKGQVSTKSKPCATT